MHETDKVRKLTSKMTSGIILVVFKHPQHVAIVCFKPILFAQSLYDTKDAFRYLPNIYDEAFFQKLLMFKTCYFCKTSPSQMFDRVLNSL